MEQFVISVRSISFARETAVPVSQMPACPLARQWLRAGPCHPPSGGLASQSHSLSLACGVGEVKTGVQEGGNKLGECDAPQSPEAS